MSDRDLHFRNRVYRAVIVLLFGILLGNLFLMMVTRHSRYKEQALKNRQVQFRVRAPRGRIFDRDGTLLAVNKFSAEITVPAASLSETGPDSTLARLLLWFGLPEQETLARLASQQERGRDPLVLVQDALMPRIAAVEERRRQLPGARVTARPRRRYIFGPLFAHIIGYVREVGRADLDTTGSSAGYHLHDMIGKQGVEASFEAELKGRSGVKLEEINASGNIVGRRAMWLEDVVPGKDVQLTLSLPLQLRLSAAIGERIACGVAISTITGEVLAAYSNPSFDPNRMTTTITPEQWDTLVNDPAKPFFNRIVQATYPPASLYKPVTSLAAFQQGIVGFGTVLEPCLGGWEFGNRFFRCWKHSGHGSLDHNEAMVQSCDTFYYQLALRLDLDGLGEAARALGLGATCSGIFPEEASGLVPDTAWYDKRMGSGGWTRGVLLNNSIGQGELLATPLQLAWMAARLASSGTTPYPVFVAAPRRPGRPVEPLPFPERNLAWVRRSLTDVVGRGTGKEGAVEGVAVAGKTGTAQNPHGEDHAMFMAFAPADEPEVAIVVIVENAGAGGSIAGPIVGRWLQEYFAMPDRPGLRPAAPPPVTLGRGETS